MKTAGPHTPFIGQTRANPYAGVLVITRDNAAVG